MRLVVDIFKNTTGFLKSEYCSKQVFKLLREGGWKLFGFCISVRAVKYRSERQLCNPAV